MPLQILISTDPRGDYLSLFCSWLGFKVVRGDSEHGAWDALAALLELKRVGLPQYLHHLRLPFAV